MSATPLNVLFLCTHNSARSILSEGLMNHLGGDRIRAYSAGSQPSGRVNPFAIKALDTLGCDTSSLSSKSWDVFATPDAPKMDVVFTVCDNAAGETCPIWPGVPLRVHWGYADPSATQGDDDVRLAAFLHTAGLIRTRLEAFLALPLETLDREILRAELVKLGAGA
ncbi:arsenate reductase ArsC [Burkholderiaceae bacterium DAT-1]|nr:arsenate reductase ArsC [Burkholderiaceae bacterium DAT-1]